MSWNISPQTWQFFSSKSFSILLIPWIHFYYFLGVMLELRIKLDLFLGISSIRPCVVAAGASRNGVFPRATAYDSTGLQMEFYSRVASRLESNSSQQTLRRRFLSQIWGASISRTPSWREQSCSGGRVFPLPSGLFSKPVERGGKAIWIKREEFIGQIANLPDISPK